MSKPIFLTAILVLVANWQLSAQTIFVDPLKGQDTQTGTATAPLATLDKAVAMAAAFTGKEPVTIKLFPGLYSLAQKLTIQLPAAAGKMVGYSIEAVTLPDDTNWLPSKMPVIQSVSGNNSDVQFPHSVGLLVAADNVKFRGLKFTGNANPAVTYYYPITKEDSLLTGLEVSQCYFAGDRYAAPIQGGIWAHGPNSSVDHCVFYNCKNALLFFKAVQHFSVTNTVIYGSYEAAMWVWLLDGQFVFRNNLIANCDYFWTIPPAASPKARFENSLFLNVDHNAANWKQGLVTASDASFVFDNVKRARKEKVLAAVLSTEPANRSGLPFIPEAEGMGAGLFRR
jgi:hypothetical protein